MLSCHLEFSGYSDYWGGMGGRGEGKGCAFAYYGKDTTLADIVDQWVDETWNNEHDFADLPESVGQSDIRNCILESLTEQGRADYHSRAVCEWSAEWVKINGCDGKLVLGEKAMIDNVDGGHAYGEIVEITDTSVSVEVDGKEYCRDFDDVYPVADEDDYDDDCESPQVILCIDWTDHPDYKPESDWALCQTDDGRWHWASKYGRETGPYPDEDAAWADMPDCPILHELREG